MLNDNFFNKLGVYLVFVVICVAFFIWLGEAVPKAWYHYAPINQFIEVKGLEAPDIRSSTGEHEVSFYRDVKRSTHGVTITELVLECRDGDLVEKKSFRNFEYFEAGDRQVKLTFDLPKDLEPGDYRYYVRINLQLPRKVVRSITVKSNQFTVSP